MINPTSLSDPPAQSAISAAALWVQGAMTGSIATSIAVIAVAAIGLMMLSGRIDFRRSITVLSGCFLLFGAPTIASALLSLVGPSRAWQGNDKTASTSLVIPLRSDNSAPRTNPFDPNAGATVPQ